MRLLHWSSLAALCLSVAAASCGKPTSGACSGVTCPAGQGCDTQTGACVLLEKPDACGNACAGTTPTCDPATKGCKVCTASAGCGGATPVCNTSVALGACVQCTADSHCGSGEACNAATSTCKPRPDGGTPPGTDAGTPDAGNPGCSPACTGLLPHCEPTTASCVACLEDSHCGPGGQCDLTTFACAQGQCVTPQPAVSCTTACQEGFVCQGGACVLRGGSGPVQVTLRWDTETDLDLEVVEPTASGPCKIWFSDPNQPGSPSSCGAVGSLDLDSNAACTIDGVDVENVIYPAGSAAPSGTYEVRVTNYDPCAVTTSFPFEVTVRANGQMQVICDAFAPGTQSSTKVITTFNVP